MLFSGIASCVESNSGVQMEVNGKDDIRIWEFTEGQVEGRWKTPEFVRAGSIPSTFQGAVEHVEH